MNIILSVATLLTAAQTPAAGAPKKPTGSIETVKITVPQTHPAQADQNVTPAKAKLQAAAAEPMPAYFVFVTATQQGNQVQIEAKIVHREPDGKSRRPENVRQAMMDPKTEVLSAPRVVLLDGSRAHMMIGTERPPKAGKADAPLPGGLYEGMRLDIIKPLDRNVAIVVTTVMKKGKIVFADAQTVKVTVKPKPGKTPTADVKARRSSTP